MMESAETLEAVKHYYGKVLQGNRDLKTSACCCGETLSESHKKILAEIDSEILDRFYGCGSPIPPALEGCTVLDLGCGCGRDAFLVSRLVGPEGFVIGVDMTEEQLAIAKKHQHAQAKRFGYERSNVSFRAGYIEDLAALAIADNSMDVVISNCVINLSPQKERVFSEIFRVLKPGGELFFSDVFASRRMPVELTSDAVLRGECLGGAIYVEDFRRLLRHVGCLDYRVCAQSRIALAQHDIQAKVGMIDFCSRTIRAFKLSALEDICEDYGQVAYYLGTLPDHPHGFALDDHHLFRTGMPMLVCGNTAAMVSETRFAKHFRVAGDRSTHYGAFSCGGATKTAEVMAAGACC